MVTSYTTLLHINMAASAVSLTAVEPAQFYKWQAYA